MVLLLFRGLFGEVCCDGMDEGPAGVANLLVGGRFRAGGGGGGGGGGLGRACEGGRHDGGLKKDGSKQKRRSGRCSNWGV